MTVQSSSSPPSKAETFEKQQTSDRSSYDPFIDHRSNQLEGARLKSPANVHKALPAVPPLASSISKAPPLVSTSTTSFAYSQDTANRPSIGSSASSSRSRSSSKTDFRIITRGLVNPDMIGRSITLSPVDCKMHINHAKYDPGDPAKSPHTPATFTSIANTTPYSNELQSPIVIPPPLLVRRTRDPTKAAHGKFMPQSRSEPTLHELDGEQEAKLAGYDIPTHISQLSPTRSQSKSSGRAGSVHRGRPINRPGCPVKMLQDVNENKVLGVHKGSRKRSGSPIKNLLGLGKSTSLRGIAGEPQAKRSGDHADKSKRNGLKIWGDKFKHGFLTSDPNSVLSTSPQEVNTTRTSLQSTLPVSLDPPYQAKVYAEMELMICVTANQYLIREVAAGRVSAESVSKICSYWSSKNRPQVIEFHYDQATQRDLILYNLTTLKFHGESAKNPVTLSATMYNWKTMAKEMSVRTFRAPDSQIRKHMHDAHKILEMLGAPLVTFLAFQELQLKTLAKINDGVKKMEEKRREERKKKIEGGTETHSRKNSTEVNECSHSRKVSRDEGES